MTEARNQRSAFFGAGMGPQEAIQFLAIGDKLADAAQAVLDHGYIGMADGYDATMHRLELQQAVKDWLGARKGEGASDG